MKYVYDGTFAGFLSAVYRIYHDGTGQMGSISASRGSGDLFGEETEVATDINHAETVADAFLKSCGTAAFRWLYRAFYVMTTVRNIFLTMYAADSNGGNLFIPIRGKSGCGKFSGVPKWRGTKRKIQGDRKVQRIGGGNALCAHSSDASCAAPHCPSFSKTAFL